MRRTRIILTAAAVIAALLLSGAGKQAPDYVGSWELDGEHNAAIIGELYTLFGSSLRHYGAALDIRADGTLQYYLGLTGGEGVYTAAGGRITADIRCYNGNRREKITFLLCRENGTPYIIYPYDDGYQSIEIRWIKRK